MDPYAGCADHGAITCRDVNGGTTTKYKTNYDLRSVMWR
jgi:hypothetical protein